MLHVKDVGEEDKQVEVAHLFHKALAASPRVLQEDLHVLPRGREVARPVHADEPVADHLRCEAANRHRNSKPNRVDVVRGLFRDHLLPMSATPLLLLHGLQLPLRVHKLRVLVSGKRALFVDVHTLRRHLVRLDVDLVVRPDADLDERAVQPVLRLLLRAQQHLLRRQHRILGRRRQRRHQDSDALQAQQLSNAVDLRQTLVLLDGVLLLCAVLVGLVAGVHLHNTLLHRAVHVPHPLDVEVPPAQEGLEHVDGVRVQLDLRHRLRLLLPLHPLVAVHDGLVLLHAELLRRVGEVAPADHLALLLRVCCCGAGGSGALALLLRRTLRMQLPNLGQLLVHVDAGSVNEVQIL
eukprot:Rhum_TRINITY_DN20976_c0_g1::Rhum_TRINITY_DN20976_c0_g1_i1::g.172748::m.172748